MTETTTDSTTESVEQPSQGALKRYAAAFAAKMRKAAAAVKAAFVRNVGDNETPTTDVEGRFRKALRYALAVPKWIGLGLLYVLKMAVTAVLLLAYGVYLLLLAMMTVIVLISLAAALLAYKVAQGLALVVRTPYLALRGDDCLKTDWVGYGLLWTPRYFFYSTISQVYFAKGQEAKEARMDAQHPVFADKVDPPKFTVHDGGKGHATPKQRKRRPARMPKSAFAGAEA